MTGEGIFSRKLINLTLLCGLGCFLAASAPVLAADENKQPPANPVGAGSNWQTDVTPNSSSEQAGDTSQADIQIGKINDYFNNIENLQGRFLQTNPDNTKVKGKFFVKRPGRLRFDYAKPSQLRIVSDGDWLSIEDHDIKTFDRYPLENTPFRMLLAKTVDLKRDAKIVDFFSDDKVTIVTLEDRTNDSNGRIKLFFDAPEISLREWIITDPQGLDTRVEVSNLEFDKEVSANFFEVRTQSSTVFQQ